MNQNAYKKARCSCIGLFAVVFLHFAVHELGDKLQDRRAALAAEIGAVCLFLHDAEGVVDVADLRGGKERVISASKLVPGDVVTVGRTELRVTGSGARLEE